jgi:phosphoglycerate kinase
MVREVNALSKLIESPQHPFVAVLGGAKISDKLGLIGALLDRVDTILVGGAMCFTFLAASGLSVGDSPVEADRIDKCRQLLNSGRILVPMDFVLARSADRSDAAWRERDVPDGWAGFDIGPESAAAFGRVIASASTVLWNGPMGVFEDSRFAAGTDVVATAVAACSGFTVVGGGDTIAAVAGLGLTPRMGYVSTGGGATLEFVERGDLPGLQALRDAARRVARS